MSRAIARFILRIFGWQAEYSVHMIDRCVLVGAPHTTNWDFPLAILGMAAMGIKFNWVPNIHFFAGHWEFLCVHSAAFLWTEKPGVPVLH